MNPLHRLKSWYRALFQKPKLDAQMDEEMRSHIEMRTRENIQAGMNPTEARYAALRQFGWAESIKETCREQRGGRWLEFIAQDVRFGARMLRKNPGFTAVAVLTLALCIGANTAIFSFVNAILIRPLPFKDPERLVVVYENQPGNGSFKAHVGAPVLAEWRKQSTSFEGLGAQTSCLLTLTEGALSETLSGSRLSANLLGLLGVRPILGRGFLPEEEVHGNHHVALLSYELWQSRFGGQTNVIGQTIQINSEPATIVGVMSARTFFPNPQVRIWTPLAFSPDQMRARHVHNYLVYGKLKPGVTLAQANAEMRTIAQRMASTDPQNQGWGAEVHALHGILVGDVRRLLLVLLGSVGLMLLIGCVNIANLLLARSVARSREFAIRVALGAGRGQLIRQLLTESLLLCLAGGLGGVLLAAFGLQALIRLSPPDLPRIWEGVHLDGTTLAYTAVITLTTGVLFGFMPTWQSASPSVAHALMESARGSASLARRRLRATLVVGEVALSVVLLIGAGLMIRTFSRLLTQNLGFNPEQVVTMNVFMTQKKYAEEARRVQLLDQLLTTVRAIPGVKAVGGVSGLPLSGWWQSSYSLDIVGAPPKKPGEASSAVYAQVSPGYFAAMNIPLLHGRDFTEHDRADTSPVIMVNESFVRSFKLGTRVLGRRVNFGDTRDAEIVGLVKDVKPYSLADPPRAQMYQTYKQKCWDGLTLVVRTQRDPDELTRAIRAGLDQFDKDQSLANVSTMTQVVASSVGQQRLSMRLLGGFAGVALLLTALGLYGVLAYTVMQRTREIGSRTALGAPRTAVIGLVLRQGMNLAGLGLILGLAGALALTRLIRSLLYGVGPTDVVTFTMVPLVLIAVALVACWLPARRAAKVDPLVALRAE